MVVYVSVVLCGGCLSVCVVGGCFGIGSCLCVGICFGFCGFCFCCTLLGHRISLFRESDLRVRRGEILRRVCIGRVAVQRSPVSRGVYILGLDTHPHCQKRI